MPKQTAKYSAALALSLQLKIPKCKTLHQESLYRELNRGGYFWDFKTKRWEQSQEQANPPSDLVRIKVTSSTHSVEEKARELANFFIEVLEYDLIVKSALYIQRPPNQSQSAMYLTFQPRD